jgi:hypothetical protein
MCLNFPQLTNLLEMIFTLLDNGGRRANRPQPRRHAFEEDRNQDRSGNEAGSEGENAKYVVNDESDEADEESNPATEEDLQTLT